MNATIVVPAAFLIDFESHYSAVAPPIHPL